MLVLSRHRDETIIIGDDIELTVVDIRGDKVRLGIKAPSHIAVHRKEVYDAIKRENERAAGLNERHIAPGMAVAPKISPNDPRNSRPSISTSVRLTEHNGQAKRESA